MRPIGRRRRPGRAVQHGRSRRLPARRPAGAAWWPNCRSRCSGSGAASAVDSPMPMDGQPCRLSAPNATPSAVSACSMAWVTPETRKFSIVLSPPPAPQTRPPGARAIYRPAGVYAAAQRLARVQPGQTQVAGCSGVDLAHHFSTGAAAALRMLPALAARQLPQLRFIASGSARLQRLQACLRNAAAPPAHSPGWSPGYPASSRAEVGARRVVLRKPGPTSGRGFGRGRRRPGRSPAGRAGGWWRPPSGHASQRVQPQRAGRRPPDQLFGQLRRRVRGARQGCQGANVAPWNSPASAFASLPCSLPHIGCPPSGSKRSGSACIACTIGVLVEPRSSTSAAPGCRAGQALQQSEDGRAPAQPAQSGLPAAGSPPGRLKRGRQSAVCCARLSDCAGSGSIPHTARRTGLRSASASEPPISPRPQIAISQPDKNHGSMFCRYARLSDVHALCACFSRQPGRPCARPPRQSPSPAAPFRQSAPV